MLFDDFDSFSSKKVRSGRKKAESKKTATDNPPAVSDITEDSPAKKPSGRAKKNTTSKENKPKEKKAETVSKESSAKVSSVLKAATFNTAMKKTGVEKLLNDKGIDVKKAYVHIKEALVKSDYYVSLDMFLRTTLLTDESLKANDELIKNITELLTPSFDKVKELAEKK
ncbi:MAG: hypothetical protein K6B41_04015 [Butyrivibrio sp.]|nr:hypothetical protein [Butyrivibrio sp.]